MFGEIKLLRFGQVYWIKNFNVRPNQLLDIRILYSVHTKYTMVHHTSHAVTNWCCTRFYITENHIKHICVYQLHSEPTCAMCIVHENIRNKNKTKQQKMRFNLFSERANDFAHMHPYGQNKVPLREIYFFSEAIAVCQAKNALGISQIHIHSQSRSTHSLHSITLSLALLIHRWKIFHNNDTFGTMHTTH